MGGANSGNIHFHLTIGNYRSTYLKTDTELVDSVSVISEMIGKNQINTIPFLGNNNNKVRGTLCLIVGNG
jgi:hypothetical protein